MVRLANEHFPEKIRACTVPSVAQKTKNELTCVPWPKTRDFFPLAKVLSLKHFIDEGEGEWSLSVFTSREGVPPLPATLPPRFTPSACVDAGRMYVDSIEACKPFLPSLIFAQPFSILDKEIHLRFGLISY